MYPVSTVVDNWLRKRNRNFAVKALVNDVEYGDDVIIDFSVENSLSLSDELELGTVIPNKLTIRFRMHSQFPPNAKIAPYIALKSDNLTWDEADMSWDEADFPWEGGTTDWIPLGVFYVDNRTRDRDIWTYVCYDQLVFADTPYVSQLEYPASMRDVWDEICAQVGFEYGDSVVIDPSYTIPAGPAGFTCRQVMGFIAAANSACVYMDKEGVVQFRRISAAVAPVFEMTESDYIRVQQTNPVKTYSRVVVIVDDEGNYYEAGTGDEAETLYVECPYGTQQIADDILSAINGFSYTPVSMPARGFPQLDQGDVIGFETVESMAWEDADIAWQDADFRWDGVKEYQTIILHQVIDFRGGLSMQIEAPSISEQKSEFPVEGTLTEAVNRLNRNAVRFGRPYYGITHSREHGFVVQREDGKSKITLNSDVMDWQVDGVSALHYDALAGKLRFRGDIIMEGGSISWSNVNAPDIDDIPNLSGRLTYIGPTGIYSGTIKTDQLIAGTAKISSALIDTIKANQIVVGDNGEKIGDGLIDSAANWNGKTTLLTPTGIYTGTIEANQINAASLSAISANLGTVTAGHIQGVTISGGVITGSLIQGATIQTSPSGRRIVLSDAFRSYDSNNVVRISIEDFPGYNYHQLQFFGEDSIRTGVISGTAGQFNFVTFNNAIMVFKGTPIVIDADTSYINFSNVPIYGLRVSINDVIDLNTRLQNIETNIVNLWNALDGKASKGALSGMTGPFNGGIPIGTNIQTTTGVVTWAGIPAHGHVQT